MHKILLYSGGIDSYLVSKWLDKKKEPYVTLYFDFGTDYARIECKYVLKAKPETIIDNCFVSYGTLEHSDAHLPNRNILAMIGAIRYGAQFIYIGGTLDDRVNDNNKDTYQLVGNLLSKLAGYVVTVDSPFKDMTKIEAIDWYAKAYNMTHEQIVRDLVVNTWSCYSGYEQECLECKACFRKSVILSYLGYVRDFHNPCIVRDVIDDLDQYTESRRKVTEQYLRTLIDGKN